MSLDFDKLVKEVFELIANKVEELDIKNIIDTDLRNDYLALYTLKGQYIMHRRSDLQQIWLVSPISGPYYFKNREGSWVSSKSPKSLIDNNIHSKNLMNLIMEEIQNNYP